MPDQGRNEPKARALRMLRQMFRHSPIIFCFTPNCDHIAVRLYRGDFLCRDCYRERREAQAR
jgi:hypothetical protein